MSARKADDGHGPEEGGGGGGDIGLSRPSSDFLVPPLKLNLGGRASSSSSSAASSAGAPPAPPSPAVVVAASNSAATSTTSVATTRIDRTPAPASPFPEIVIEPDVLHRLRRYVLCFAIVRFDLDSGPDLTETYPPIDLPTELKANIAFSSLPEGEDQLPTAGAHCYSWRIPLSKTTLKEGTTSVLDRLVGKGKSQAARGSLGEEHEGDEQEVDNPGGQEDGHLHGFVYFLQEKNESVRRGYTQRSLVLITHRPSLVGVFSSTIATLGPLHFKHDAHGGMIESACYNIASWPDLSPGATLDFPFLGVVHSVAVPIDSQPQWPRPPSSAAAKIPASVPLTPLSVALHDSLSFSKILLLWELVLLGDPILLFTSDPRTGSELVHHLRNLIRPIAFAGDYRPYFHIHDGDFQKIANPQKPPAGAIISTTNPLVLRQCSPWPNILRTVIGKTEMSTAAVVGLTSTRKRHVKKDASVAKAVDVAFKNGDYVTCDSLIFKHLATLTEQFLAPLNRYFGTLPNSTSASNGKSSTTSRPTHTRNLSSSLSAPPSSTPFPLFTPSEFLFSLKFHGTPLPFRTTTTSSVSSTVERFYSRFLTSPNFTSWLSDRADRTGDAVRSRWLTKLEGADLDGWARGREGKEVEELIGRLETEASRSEKVERQRSLSASPAGKGRHSPSPRANSGNEGVRSVSSRSEKLRTQAAKLRSLRSTSMGTTTTTTPIVGGLGITETDSSDAI